MATAKKNVSVAYVLDRANTHLKGNYGDHAFREGIIAMLKGVLHITGNYNGFVYLEAHEVPEGAMAGINSGVDLDYNAKFLNTDPTRVRYL